MLNKVLIVEDNKKNMILETDLLELEDVQVFQAYTATEGIELTIKEKPDLIIMDVRLPDMRGTEAVEVIRQNKEVADVPVVFVTASVMEQGIEDVKAVPNSMYVSKPIDVTTFVDTIKSAEAAEKLSND